MSKNKKIKFIELSIILLKFLSSLITLIVAGISYSEIEKIIRNDKYEKFILDPIDGDEYIFDILNKRKSNFSFPNNNHLLNVIYRDCNVTCVNPHQQGYDKWKNSSLILKRTKELNFPQFEIIKPNENCQEGYKECYKGKFYKTCIFSKEGKNVCPITAVLNMNNMNNHKINNFLSNNTIQIKDITKRNSSKYKNLNNEINQINQISNYYFSEDEIQFYNLKGEKNYIKEENYIFFEGKKYYKISIKDFDGYFEKIITEKDDSNTFDNRIIKNDFYNKNNNYYFSRNISGIPIVDIKVMFGFPCKKQNNLVNLLIVDFDLNTKKYYVNYLDCDIWKNIIMMTSNKKLENIQSMVENIFTFNKENKKFVNLKLYQDDLEETILMNNNSNFSLNETKIISVDNNSLLKNNITNLEDTKEFLINDNKAKITLSSFLKYNMKINFDIDIKISDNEYLNHIKFSDKNLNENSLYLSESHGKEMDNQIDLRFMKIDELPFDDFLEHLFSMSFLLEFSGNFKETQINKNQINSKSKKNIKNTEMIFNNDSNQIFF